MPSSARLVTPNRALRAIGDVGPTLVFLAAILVVSEVAERAGLFDAAGSYPR